MFVKIVNIDEDNVMKYLIIPGLNDSGEKHWQSLWADKLDCIRLNQKNWSEPILDDWLVSINNAINDSDENLILVAHSLGCALVLNWVQRFSSEKIKAALLVAPADVDSEIHTPDVVRNFSPMPLIKLPFKTILVASENDPYMSIERSRYFSNVWDCAFVNVGNLGHINADSNLDVWEFGLNILKNLNR